MVDNCPSVSEGMDAIIIEVEKRKEIKHYFQRFLHKTYLFMDRLGIVVVHLGSRLAQWPSAAKPQSPEGATPLKFLEGVPLQ